MYFIILLIGIFVIAIIFDQLRLEAASRQEKNRSDLANARVCVTYVHQNGQKQQNEYLLDSAEITFGRDDKKCKSDRKIPTSDPRMSRNAIRLIYDGNTFCIKRLKQETVWLLSKSGKIYVLCSKFSDEENLKNQMKDLFSPKTNYTKTHEDISLEVGDRFYLGETVFEYLREEI